MILQLLFTVMISAGATAAFYDTDVVLMDSSGNVLHRFPALSALFGSGIPDTGVSGSVAYSSPIDACATVEHAPRHLGNGTRWIALVRRNQCSFTQKVQNVQRAGFIAAVIHNIYADSLVRMHGTASSIRIPSAFIGATTAEILAKYNYSTAHTIELKPAESGYKFLLPFVCVLVICMCVMVMFTFLKYACGKIYMYIKRVSKFNLRKLPVKKFKKGDIYDMCAICLEEYKVGDKLRIMPCSHAFHRKCIDPWLTTTNHTCPLCKKKVFRHASTSDDSDSDRGNVENGGTNASERTPLLASGARSAATASSRGMPTSVTTSAGDASDHAVRSAGVAAEEHWSQSESSVEIHREQCHSASSPDQHIAGNTLLVDTGEPPTAADSCSVTSCADAPVSVSDATTALADNPVSSSSHMLSSQHVMA